MRRLKDQYGDALVVIGVHSAKFPSEQLTANIREAVLRHGIDHPVVNDAAFEVWRQYAVRAWPTVVLIDPEGYVIATEAGEVQAEDFGPVLDDLVRRYEAGGALDRSPLESRPERAGVPERPLAFPARVLATDDGRLFIADTGHHRVLEVRLSEDGASGEITDVFGSGLSGMADGNAANATFNAPHGLALAGDTLFVADTDNHAIRAVDLSAHTVRSVAGTGEKAHGRAAMGIPTQTPLRSPWDVLTVEGILFIAMAGSHQVWAMVGDDRLGVFAGNGREALVDGPRAEASFNQPSGLAYGLGHLFVADAEASAIRAIALDDEVTVYTLVGQGLFEFGDVDGTGAGVRLQHPAGLAFLDDLLYVADTYNNKIKTLDPTTGETRTLIATGLVGMADGAFEEAGLSEPEGVSAIGGRLYIADTNNHLVRVAYLAARTIRTLALSGLERLHLPLAFDRRAERLEPVAVAPGRSRLRLRIALPGGLERNPDAPLTVVDLETGSVITAANGEDPIIPVDAGAGEEVALDLTVYACDHGDNRTCSIHDARIVVPVRVEEGAPEEASVEYRVDA